MGRSMLGHFTWLVIWLICLPLPARGKLRPEDIELLARIKIECRNTYENAPSPSACEESTTKMANTVFYNLSLDIPIVIKKQVFEEDFDPVRAMKAMGILCTDYFALNPMPTERGVLYCNYTFDSFSCWPTTLAGYLAIVPCPKIPITDSSANATKVCYENGTWEIANYTDCFVEESPQTVLFTDFYDSSLGITITYDVGYAITIIALLVALCIFTYFKSLRCLRNSIHSNLIVAFILNILSWTVLRNSLSPMYVNAPTWLCRLVVVVCVYFNCVPFYWMFVEGLYLFTIIVWAFSAQKIRLWYYHIIGWGMPVIVTVVWAVVKSYSKDVICWFPMAEAVEYILHGPILFLLSSNIFFIVAIIWVLVTKMRASNTLEIRQYSGLHFYYVNRKAVKATVVLGPLLGITYFFLLFNTSKSRFVSGIYTYINAFLQSFQGLFVAIFYCFLNGEVQSLLRQKIAALQDSRTLSRYTKSSIFNSPRRSSYAMTACNGKGDGTKRTSGSSSQTKVVRLGEAETEASASMMDNML